MCGIAGACGTGASQLRPAVQQMCDQMLPRGPDDDGMIAVSNGIEAVLGSRRLAIIDPSPAGHQPFVDPHRGNVVVYNGMIYNYRTLRRELEAAGEQFSSDCDTEVVLKCYGVFGSECVTHLHGMFAFALWDATRAELFLARDRLGIKPLYYSVDTGRLLFASQVKALLASGVVPRRLSPDGIESFLAFGAVSEPSTILEGVSALPAGHHAVWSREGLRTREYWSPRRAMGRRRSEDDAPSALRSRLEMATASHLVSDVPVGIFLSGGLDSSALAGLASAHADRVRAVSVTFAEPEYSEGAYQRQVAERLGCEHVLVRLGASELFDDLEAAFSAMDQPSFDAVNTYAVSRAASESGLKVALSGLGADELFDGYGQLARVRRLEALRRLPRSLQRGTARAAGIFMARSRSKKMDAWLSGELPAGASYELLRGLFLPQEIARLVASNREGAVGWPDRLNRAQALAGQVSCLELTNYMKNVLLRDTDAMSMATSLEVRVPFLDDELVSWVLASGGSDEPTLTKRSLADAVGDVIPNEVATRKKHGFGVPISEWMRSDLREEVDARLRETPGALQDHIDGKVALDVWNGFLKGREHWTRPWALYALSRWSDTIEHAHELPNRVTRARVADRAIPLQGRQSS